MNDFQCKACKKCFEKDYKRIKYFFSDLFFINVNIFCVFNSQGQKI